MSEDRRASGPRRKVSRRRYLISIVVLAVVGLVFASLALGHIGNYEVISDSMAPTLRAGDRVLVDQRPGFVPAVGDVVVLQDPINKDCCMTKRLAALGGQTVEIIDGYLYIDGKRWSPPGQAAAPIALDARFRPREPMTLSPGKALVLGDNQHRSEDSLYFGPVPTNSIKGELLFIYWPPHRLGRVK